MNKPEETEEAKPFKALTLNRKILEQPQFSIERKSAPPQSFLFKEFKFKTDERCEEHMRQSQERLSTMGRDSLPFAFKARKMPKFPSPPSPQRSQMSTFTAFNGKSINNHTSQSSNCTLRREARTSKRESHAHHPSRRNSMHCPCLTSTK